ncbi:DNA topoisomerase I [Clostridium tetani 12124569]|nr:DNA topoisomerase I [Clostridium tetani 12124569]
MSIAQQLYEGIDIKGHGTIGLITYMRTDSVRISKEAQDKARQFLENVYGKEYIPEKPRYYKGKKNIQDAHEAIRPTNIEITPKIALENLNSDQYKLYSLIWNRFMASQMAACIMEVNSVDVKNSGYIFRATGSIVKFDGFMIIYEYLNEDEKENINIPKLEKGELLKEKSIDGKQHFTQPPGRFSEASLVKVLEDNGIGRPSTYAPIISTLLERTYIERENRTLKSTELGVIVNNIMVEYFKPVVDAEFTAEMENKLDSIEEGNENWKNTVDEFYSPLKELIETAEKEVEKVTLEEKVTDVKCEKCGNNMVVKHGRFGDFLACPGYPECKNTKPIVHQLDVKCPKCNGEIVLKKSKKGRKFYGCSNYPKCDFVSWFEPVERKCDVCGNYMVKRYTKAKGDYIECSNKECKHKIMPEKKQE